MEFDPFASIVQPVQRWAAQYPEQAQRFSRGMASLREFSEHRKIPIDDLKEQRAGEWRFSVCGKKFAIVHRYPVPPSKSRSLNSEVQLYEITRIELGEETKAGRPILFDELGNVEEAPLEATVAPNMLGLAVLVLDRLNEYLMSQGTKGK